MLGDHIRALKGGKWIHGIDLGDQRVLHLAEDARLAPGDRLRRVYKPDFAAGASRVELVVHRERTYPARAVVARAWSRFMDPSVVAMFRDSEQFAAWCKVGRLPEGAPASAPPAASRVAQVAPAARPAPKPGVKLSLVPTGTTVAPPAEAAPRKKAPAARKPAAGKAKAAKKPAPRKAAARKAPAKKPAARKGVAKKAATRKPAARKAAGKARKAPARAGTPAKKKGRR